MRFKKSLLLFCGALLVAGVLTICLAPLLVAGGLRLWIAYTARQEGLRIEFEKIEAPLLRPVIVQKLRIASQAGAPFRVMIEAPRVEVGLNFAAIFSRSSGRFLRFLMVEALSVDIRQDPQPAPASRPFAWQMLEDLLADNFKLSGVELHIENGDTVVDLRNGVLSGAQIEAGVFSASELTIVSPLFRKTFSNLSGATSWQESRLTVGALTLTRGLDLDAVTIDLSHIGESRLGLEMAMDAFGGKLRARISSQDRADKRTWDVAGAVSEISLAQMSDALDLTDRASGSLHACNFTFRGEVTNLREATATIWGEVTGFTWRDRTADTIMIGASLYNRQVQVGQLFVKQRNNQFTLTGESTLPQTWSGWLNPDFHGDISASIKDLGDFARLFGASPSDFSGEIDIAGNVSAQERKLGGQLSASGNSLILFRAPFESFNLKLGLKESRLEIASLELRRKDDAFFGRGSLDLTGNHSYSFTFKSSIADVADYAALIPEMLQPFHFGGGLELNWTGNGTEAAHSGTFQARGHGLHPLDSPVIPFDAEFEGDYSPENIFFRQFSLSNQHAAFSAFVAVTKDYFQLQTLHLDLNGKPKLQGNVFVPVSLSKIRARNDWLAALSEDANFDLDITLDPVDLAELSSAVVTHPKMSGQAAGKIEIYGTPASLESKSSIRLHDFVFENERRVSVDLEARAGLGTFNGKANMVAPGSDPVTLEGAIPYKFEKREAGYTLGVNGPYSATLNFPVILLPNLPHYLSREIFTDGILSGNLTLSDSLLHPVLLGNLHLINGRFVGGLSLSTGITFRGRTAAIDFAQLTKNNVRYGVHGGIDFRESTDIATRIFPTGPMVVLTPLEPDNCIDGIELFPGSVADSQRERVNELDVRGNLFTATWMISLGEKHPDDPHDALLSSGSSQTFPVCHDLQPPGKTLTLGSPDRLFLDESRGPKSKRRRR